MYINPRFPSLVETVLAKQREEELKKLQRERWKKNDEEFKEFQKAWLETAKRTSGEGIDKLPSNRVVIPSNKKRPYRNRDVPIHEGKRQCNGCHRQVPLELHKLDCPVLKGNTNG